MCLSVGVLQPAVHYGLCGHLLFCQGGWGLVWARRVWARRAGDTRQPRETAWLPCRGTTAGHSWNHAEGAVRPLKQGSTPPRKPSGVSRSDMHAPHPKTGMPAAHHGGKKALQRRHT